MSAFDAVLAELADAVAERVVSKLKSERASWIDQTRSPLGRKRHCAAVRRRVEQGEDGASIVGRKHLLSREGLDAELAALSGRKRPSRAKPEKADIEPLLARYGITQRKAG